MVVPNTAVSVVKYFVLNCNDGQTIARAAASQSTCATNAVTTYANKASVSHLRYFTYVV